MIPLHDLVTLDQALKQPLTEDLAALIFRSTFRLGHMTFTITSMGGSKEGPEMRIHVHPLDISMWVVVGGDAWCYAPGWGDAVMDLDVIDLLGMV